MTLKDLPLILDTEDTPLIEVLVGGRLLFGGIHFPNTCNIDEHFFNREIVRITTQAAKLHSQRFVDYVIQIELETI